MSNIRGEVEQLIAEGLSLNEIAHRLGVANSTVGYHVDVLRREDKPPAQRLRRNTGPVAPPASTRERVRRLLAQGMTRAETARTLGVTRSTVSYHARRLGERIDDRCGRRYDWEEIRRFYEAGHSARECRDKFGFNMYSWHAAIKRGVITARPPRIPLEQLLVDGPRRNRGHVKGRLFDAGVKARRCEVCGLCEWRGHPIPLTLHHVNGERHDNRLENLQILCANCHGQTDNWAGRNRIGRQRPVSQA